MSKFVKGQSGNPKGRPKDLYGIGEYARAHCIEALDVIRSIYNDLSAKDEIRTRCAQIMLDRGVGPVPRPVTITSDSDGRVPDLIEHLPNNRVEIEKLVNNELIK